MELGDLLMRVRMSGFDEVDKNLDKLGSKAEKAEGKSKKLGDALGSFSRLGGPIGGVADTIGDLTDKADGSVASFGKLRGGIALVAVIAATAIASVVKLTLAVADMADALNDMANRTNISTERLSLMDAMAKMAGSSVEELVASSEKLAAKLAKQDEESGKAVTALKDLGISTKDANGETKSMLALQEEIVLAVDKATDRAKAEGAAILLLGNDYHKLKTAIKETAEQKSEMYDYMRRVGAVVTTKLAKDSDTLNDNISKLGLSFKGMGISIADITVPILNKVIEKLGAISAKAADIMRRWGGGSTATELATDRVGSIEAQLAYKRRALGGYGNKAKLNEEIAQLEAELAAAQSDVRFARTADERTKNETINGKKDEGIRPAGKTPTPTDPTKTPEALESMRNAQERQRARNAEYDGIEKYFSNQYIKGIEDAKKLNEELDKQAERIKNLADPYRELQTELDLINHLRDKGRLADDEYAAAVQQNTLKVIDAHKKQNESHKEMSDFGKLTFNTLSSAITDLAMGADISAKSIAKAFIKAAMDMLVIQPMLEGMKKIFSEMGSGGGGGGIISAIAKVFTKSANGNVFGSAGLLKSASGNVFDGPVLHGFQGGVGVLGEAGPEAVMPLKRGANGILGVQVVGGGGGASIDVGGIYVTVQGGGKDAKRDGELAGGAAAEAFVARIARAEIGNALRYGGALNR